MGLAELRSFFLWCTIIDFGVMLVWFAFLTFGGGWVYAVHSKWFPMPRETFNVVIYSLMGVFKIIFICFALVPYIALCIVG